MDIIGEGAEARIVRTADGVVKERPQKAYRHPDLDKRLRQFRTRREAKILSRLPVSGPALVNVDDKGMRITMSHIEGAQLREVLSAENAADLGRRLGRMVRAIHDAGIVHGDLTTSNVLVSDGGLFLIDFGLSAFSDHVEDKAVDLHLLFHALSAKHPDLPLWENVRGGYGADEAVWQRFEDVERRGRYKKKG